MKEFPIQQNILILNFQYNIRMKITGNLKSINNCNNLQIQRQNKVRRVYFGMNVTTPAIPKDLTYAREAIGELVHHFKPLSDLSKEVTETVPKGNGHRTAAIIGRLYDPKNIVSPVLKDTFEEQERFLVENGQSPIAINKLRQFYYTLSNFIGDFGKQFSEVNWTSLKQ